ncbi:MAG: glycosyltransferase [Gammaproteobacteria bacterium]|nr:MAG: glycosyltransferase [Gammaproteobacteria bacterium]RKZ41739.1 MAG: glycosyltransferase [Gammaproteobacteria bacterium]RKZ76004.1 MAG: glycosyltransferase [Gammaproteobacteria bacterium]
MEKSILQVFAKAPIPGKVKTRLIPVLGDQGACDLHQQLVKDCLQKFCDFFTLQLWCSEYHPFFQACQTHFGVSLHRQQGVDLGERMAYALASVAPAPVILIGSDCPSLEVQTIEDGFAALRQGETVVLAPAEDGGYVLIGMQRLVGELFIDMPWGSSQVLTLTRTRLRELELDWKELPTQWDIDYPKDVERWQMTTDN